MAPFVVPVRNLENALRHGAKLKARPHDAAVQRTLSVIPLGTLKVRSGRLIAGDIGMSFQLSEPFVRRVAPGEYPVWVTIWGIRGRGWLSRSDGMGDTPRAAYLSLVLAQETAVRYEFAATGDKPIDWQPDCPFDGLGVDVGGVGLLDAENLPLVQSLPESTDWLKLNDEGIERSPQCAGVAGRVHLPIQPPIEVPMAESGWGDGSYFSYWGLNAADKPVVLIVDFDLDKKFNDY